MRRLCAGNTHSGTLSTHLHSRSAIKHRVTVPVVMHSLHHRVEEEGSSCLTEPSFMKLVSRVIFICGERSFKVCHRTMHSNACPPSYAYDMGCRDPIPMPHSDVAKLKHSPIPSG